MRLITELSEDLQYITEVADEKTGIKDYYIEGVFMQANVKNRNGRIYPKDILQKEAKRYEQNYINQNRAFGELGHPEGPTVNLERVSHLIQSLKMEGNNFIGKAKVMDTPYGKIVKNLIDEGARLGVSSRGMGSLKPAGRNVSQVQDDFYLATAADIVADPSAPAAFVNGIMEGREWTWDNGLLDEREITRIKHDIQHKSINEVKAFETFMSKL